MVLPHVVSATPMSTPALPFQRQRLPHTNLFQQQRPQKRQKQIKTQILIIATLIVIFSTFSLLDLLDNDDYNHKHYPIRHRHLQDGNNHQESEVNNNYYREEAIRIMLKTPGFNPQNIYDGIPKHKKFATIDLEKMYVYASREGYERMRDGVHDAGGVVGEGVGDVEIGADFFPMPYHSLLHPQTIQKLGLPPSSASTSSSSSLIATNNPNSNLKTNTNSKPNPKNNSNGYNYIRPYTIKQAIQTLSHFESEAFLLRYSSIKDEFKLYVSKSLKWNTVLAAHARAVEEVLIPILRMDHGGWFQKYSFDDDASGNTNGDQSKSDKAAAGKGESRGRGGRDFAVVISTGDSPKLSCECMQVPGMREENPPRLEWEMMTKTTTSTTTDNANDECNRYNFSPIWQFGSGFVNPEIIPTLVTFAPWNKYHLGCFASYRFEKKVCKSVLEWDEEDNLEGIYFGRHELEISLDDGGDVGDGGKDEDGAGVVGEGANIIDEEEEVFASSSDINASSKLQALEEQNNELLAEDRRRTLHLLQEFAQQDSALLLSPQIQVPIVYYDSYRRQLVEGANDSSIRESINHNNGNNNGSPYGPIPKPYKKKTTLTVPIFSYLRPQIMWRGTDFSFLNCMTNGHHYFHLTPDQIPEDNSREGFTEGLFHIWGSLTPRWKAVALSLEADRVAKTMNEVLHGLKKDLESDRLQKNVNESRGTMLFPEPDVEFKEVLPWIDAKFTDKQRSPSETKTWMAFHESGGDIVGGYMNWKEASSFKYHIDIGGGGGTTWQGTLGKLALPGLLFHHESPTFDFYQEDMIPFVHYVPVSTELPDLKEKFEWAENHPNEARAISDAATAFVRYMGTSEYWERAYDRMFIKRVHPTLEAFQPMEMPVFTSKEEADGYDDEVAFFQLAKDLGFPLKRLFP